MQSGKMASGVLRSLAGGGEVKSREDRPLERCTATLGNFQCIWRDPYHSGSHRAWNRAWKPVGGGKERPGEWLIWDSSRRDPVGGEKEAKRGKR